MRMWHNYDWANRCRAFWGDYETALELETLCYIVSIRREGSPYGFLSSDLRGLLDRNWYISKALWKGKTVRCHQMLNINYITRFFHRVSALRLHIEDYLSLSPRYSLVWFWYEFTSDWKCWTHHFSSINSFFCLFFA